jgi:chromosome segregation ATPase
VIEHPNRAGWKLTSAARPDETAPNVYRFRVQAPPTASATLVVEELRALDTSYQVTSITDDQLALFVRQQALTPEVEQALRAIMAKKGELAAANSEVAQRKDETEQIFRDQERLRENLKALKGSSEERSLVARYTRQLDEQETRLDALRREIAEREAKRARLQAELDALVQGLSYGGK